MSLANKNWIGLDGKPVTGTVPPQLLMMQGQLTPERYGAVAHAYHLFCLGKVTAVGDFFISNRVLTDGTRVRCESMQNIDRVLVWADGDEDGMVKLPHGFGVITNWQAPRFYWKPDKITWQAPGNTPPQLQLGGGVTYNHVTYEITKGDVHIWEFFPVVYNESKDKLWGWAPHKAREPTRPLAPGEQAPPALGPGRYPVIPIALTYKDATTGRAVRRSHSFAADARIFARNGRLLYTMEDIPSMTTNGNDPVRMLPPCSDATGSVVVLQQYRRWLVSPTNEIYRFRTGSETLARTGPEGYSSFERQVEEFSTALRLPNNEAQFGDTLPEEPEDPSLHRLTGAGGGTWQIGTIAYTPQGLPYVIPDPYWSSEIRWVAYGCNWLLLGEEEFAGILREGSGGWRRHQGAPRDNDKYPYFLCMPAWKGADYCSLINGLAYPPTINMMALSKGSGVRANFSDVKNCYGLLRHLLYRRVAEHSIAATPKLTLGFAWTTFLMLEGVVTGDYKGHANEDHRTVRNSYIEYQYETEVVKNWWTYTDLTGMSNDDGGGTVGYTKLNATMGSLVDFAAIKAAFPGNGITLVDDSDKREPTCTGGYNYKTRYILDFDNRAQFCASIRVEVSCQGARWKQIPGAYLGALQDEGPAQYTVAVFFEVRVGGTVYDKLLVGESVSKKAFEFRAIEYDNVLIWPQSDADRRLWVYMPPELVPPMEAHMHLEAIATPQGINPHFAGHDAPVLSSVPAKYISACQLEGSKYNGQKEIPHPRRPTGSLYVRAFTLGEYLSSALWMFGRDFLKFDAPENLNYLNPDSPPWHYFPVLGQAITSGEKIHIEFRDGEFVDWPNDIPAVKGGPPKPPKDERIIEVYYI